MFTEHKLETGNGLLNRHATSPTWRPSAPISTSGLLLRLEENLMTLKGTNWTTIVHKNTNNEPSSAYRMVKLPSLGGATYHRFPLPVRFDNWKSAKTGKR
jgi:hypothetical protein